jgi:hypothetical protein
MTMGGKTWGAGSAGVEGAGTAGAEGAAAFFSAHVRKALE